MSLSSELNAKIQETYTRLMDENRNREEVHATFIEKAFSDFFDSAKHCLSDDKTAIIASGRVEFNTDLDAIYQSAIKFFDQWFEKRGITYSRAVLTGREFVHYEFTVPVQLAKPFQICQEAPDMPLRIFG